MGRVHFVSPSASYTVDGRTYIASDDNDGLSPERALLTFGQAYTNVTASAGEVILLLEGTHTLTATQRLQKAGITIAGVRSAFASDVGVGQGFSTIGYRSKVAFSGVPGFSIEANNIEMCHLEIRPGSGYSGVIFRNASPDALYMHDCQINLAAGQAISTATVGIDFGYRADTAGLSGNTSARVTNGTTKATAYLENISFISEGAQGPGIVTATCDLTVVRARFHNRAGIWATPFMVASGTGFVFVQGSHWTAQAAATGIGTCVDGSMAGIIAGKALFSDCRFPIRNAGTNSQVDNFTANVVHLVECYAPSTAGAGGGLPQGVPDAGQATPYSIYPSA